VPSAVALIPARGGSERIPGKNVKPLAGHPLIAYSIATALQSDVFERLVVSTDSEEIAAIATSYGAAVPGLRPAEMASATSPDIEWVRHALVGLADRGLSFDLFSILRPTSPFRGPRMVQRAFEQLIELGGAADSLRAVRLCREHPGKMWTVDGDLMEPLLAQPDGLPLHSQQYKALPPVYVQSSSLEIAWTRVALDRNSISGDRVAPFFGDELESFSIDYPDDWRVAEDLAARNPERLPTVRAAAR
jgi:CMP-N,N'-diacetyllegionaminic acid synthase